MKKLIKRLRFCYFFGTIDQIIEQFSIHFVEFRKFEDWPTQKLIKYSDTVDFEFFYITMFDWMELQAYEMQLLSYSPAQFVNKRLLTYECN